MSFYSALLPLRWVYILHYPHSWCCHGGRLYAMPLTSPAVCFVFFLDRQLAVFQKGHGCCKTNLHAYLFNSQLPFACLL